MHPAVPHPGFSRASRSTRTRIERTVRGRPGLRGRDQQACRRATRSRCQRGTVSGCTTRFSPLSTSLGSRCSSAASNARSARVNRTLSGPSCRGGPGAGGAAQGTPRPCPGCSPAAAAAARTRSPHRDRPVAAARSTTMPQRFPSHERYHMRRCPSPVQRLQPARMWFSAGARLPWRPLWLF